MRTKSLVFSIVLAVAVAGSVKGSQHTEKKAAPAGGKAVMLAAEDLKWEDVAALPGGKMVVVKGDSKKGAWAGFMKLPAGAAAPLHTHSADHHVAVISGTMTLTPEGGEAKKLGAGSWFEFTGKKKHTTTCEAGADCVIFVVAKGAWDMVPVEAKK